MPDDQFTFDRDEQRRRDESASSNHVIWGMTTGVLLGSALGFIVFDNVGVGVAIGIVLGAVLATIFHKR